MFSRSIFLACCLASVSGYTDATATVDGLAADAASAVADSAKPSWLLVVCGLPGDDAHRERLSGAVEQIMSAATSVLQVPTENVTALVGDEAMQETLQPTLDRTLEICTRESLQDAVTTLCETVPANADCWIILLGHADLYAGKSRFNVQGPDLDQTDMAAWLQPLQAKRQIVLVTMPVSGFWLKPLAGANRIVVSATEADQEYTGTEMPYALADVLTGRGEHEKLRDADGDGEFSLFDLYVIVNLEIHGRFKSLERLQTEHAQLEDNGDGRGSEVQSPYIPADPVETEEVAADDQPDDEDVTQDVVPVDGEQVLPTEPKSLTAPKPITNESMDGYHARQVLLDEPADQ